MDHYRRVGADRGRPDSALEVMRDLLSGTGGVDLGSAAILSSAIRPTSHPVTAYHRGARWNAPSGELCAARPRLPSRPQGRCPR